MFGKSRVEILSSDAGVRGKVVDDGFLNGNVVVYKRKACIFPLSANDGCAGKSIDYRANGFAFAIRIHLDFGLAYGDKFCVQGYYGVRSRTFSLGVENFVCFVL